MSADETAAKSEELCDYELPFPCDQCENTFQSSKDWMVHVREADDHEAICKACDISFKNFDNMRHHKRKYHFEKSASKEFYCESCGKGCKTRDLLKDHWNFVHKVEYGLNCNLCGRSCQNLLKLRKHTQLCLTRDPEIVAQERLLFEAAATDSKNYQPSQYSIQAHSLELNPPVVPNLNARNEYCSYGESKVPTLPDKSKVEDNPTMEIKQETSVCEQMYFDEGHLGELNCQGDSKGENNEVIKSDTIDGLIKIETEPDIDQIVRIPNKKVRKENNIPVVPKVCPICAKEVKYLNGHIKEVHTDAPSENHICNHCGKVFARLKKLRGHIDAVHKVQPTMCDICSQEFKNHHALRGHKAKVHESINEVSCPSCFKAFETRLKLYYHERAVHTLEDARCQFCGRTYKNKNLLQKHVKVYHKELYEAQKNSSLMNTNQLEIEDQINIFKPS